MSLESFFRVACHAASAVQTVAFIFSFPFMIIMLLMVVSLVKALGTGKKDQAYELKQSQKGKAANL